MTGDLQWDWLRTFEAVARFGSLTAGARALRMSQSTASRHLARLEEYAKAPLLNRQNPVRLTARGEELLAAIVPMVEAATVASSAIEPSVDLQGEVTITTVSEMLRWVLSSNFASFCKRYPALRLRVLASAQVSSLAAGEADIALRLGRPDRGDLFTRKLAEERYGFFVSPAAALGSSMPWLGLTGALAHISEQRYANECFAGRLPRLLVEDVETLGLLVKQGLGCAILPKTFAGSLSLREVVASEVGAEDLGAIPSRELWMLVHRSKKKIPRVRAVMAWIEEVFALRKASS